MHFKIAKDRDAGEESFVDDDNDVMKAE